MISGGMKGNWGESMLEQSRDRGKLTYGGASAHRSSLRASFRSTPNPAFWFLALCIGALLMSPVGQAEEESDNFLELSLEELLNVEVTSVSKSSQKRTEAAAAIYVLTAEDIRRSGARSLPDLLRLVPGLNVAQLTTNTWSVTARGFGGRFANKLLVLIDGRSIYTPLFSGVYWEAHDVVLEDIDRIEVIRGPGGSLWGANAVNGVINVVTKRAEDTQGGLLVVGGGTEEQGFGTFRFGGKIKDRAHYRLYGKYFNRDNGGTNALGTKANDYWDSGQGGFRIDWDVSERDELTFQGDIVELKQGQSLEAALLTPPFETTLNTPSDYSGRNVLGRWTRTFSEESDLQLQLYYDYYMREDPTLSEERQTIDLDFQHRFQAGSRNQVIWGAGFRYTVDELANTTFISLTPDSRDDEIFSLFIQDEITILDELRLTIGTKIELNSYSGLEYQPSARLAWTPNERHTVWAAVSRAVRTPSRAEQDIHILSVVFPPDPSDPSALPTAAVLQGTRNFDSENLLAYEIGYRVSPHKRVALDVAAFYNDYDDYRSLILGTPVLVTVPPPAHISLPFFALNTGSATAYGVEVAVDWKVKKWWQLHASYAFMETDISVPPGDPISNTATGDTPEHQAVLQSRFDLPHNVELDATLRYVDTLTALGIEDYLELDLRLGWRPIEDLELSLVGRNLLESEHFEFSPTFVTQTPTQIQRSVYAQLTWRF